MYQNKNILVSLILILLTVLAVGVLGWANEASAYLLNAADLLGQLDENYNPVYTKDGGDNSPNQFGFSSPHDNVIDPTNHRLFVAHTVNNRVLVFNLDAGNNLQDRIADYVLGQNNFYAYNGATTQNNFSHPHGLSYDSTNQRLFVAATYNHRVLVFDLSSGISNGMNAAYVLGQADFESSSSNLTQDGLSYPLGFGYDKTNKILFVNDDGNNRVTVFDLSTVTNGENAINVLGQADFNSSDSGVGQNLLNYPEGSISYDESSRRLFISDTWNHRVLVFQLPKITTVSLPSATVGQNYAATISVTGGAPPYASYLVSGFLPAGLTLNPDCTITGTPSSASEYNFTVRVYDSAVTPPETKGFWCEKSFSLTVLTPQGGESSGAGATTPPAEKVEKPVQPGTTTTVEIPGKVKVEVPPAVVVGVNPVLKAEVVNGARAAGVKMPLVSPVVDVSISAGTLTGEITITFHFDKGKLEVDQEPAVFSYDEAQGKWVRLKGRMDLDKGNVTVKVSHLTLFAVFAVAKEVSVKPSARLTFPDITGHWAEETVSELVYRGIISGYPDGSLRPDKNISRAESAAILTRALKLTPGSEQELKFKDNASIPTWARGAVAAVVREGLLQGYPQPDGTVAFEVKRTPSRTEMARLVAQVLQNKLGAVAPAELAFADAAEIPAWARPSVGIAVAKGVGIAVAKGVVSGYPDNTFRARRPVSCAETVTMVQRLLEVNLERSRTRPLKKSTVAYCS